VIEWETCEVLSCGWGRSTRFVIELDRAVSDGNNKLQGYQSISSQAGVDYADNMHATVSLVIISIYMHNILNT
jgi:hypothetical protein